MSVTHPLLPPILATLHASTRGSVRGDSVKIDLREALVGEWGPLLARLLWSTPSISVDKIVLLLGSPLVSAWAELLDGNPTGMVITGVNSNALKTWVLNEAWAEVLSSVLSTTAQVSLVRVSDNKEVVLTRKGTMHEGLDVVRDVLRGEHSTYQAGKIPRRREYEASTANEKYADLWDAIIADVTVLLRACTEALRTTPLDRFHGSLTSDEAAQVLWAGLRFGDISYVVGECRGGMVMDLVRARAYRSAGVSAREARTIEFGNPSGVPTFEALHLLGGLTS